MPYQFYFDADLLLRKVDKEARGHIKGAGIFLKGKLLAQTLEDIEKNRLMRRQLVHLDAKGEFLHEI